MRPTARHLSIFLALAAAVVLAAPARALDDEGVFAKNKLAEIIAGRPDLQAAFPEGRGNAAMVAAGMNTVEDWARRYGRKEFPNELAWYGRASVVLPKALIERNAARAPVAIDTAAFDFSGLSAHSVLVIDAATRKVLLSNRADDIRSIASITK
ncbi:hypothetical protein HY633_00820, partial [Candidatus Uhrbacteria bacterium]|nr:hypothetical protein [Candidatus Uhrbacteria bacterium]